MILGLNVKAAGVKSKSQVSVETLGPSGDGAAGRGGGESGREAGSAARHMEPVGQVSLTP